MELAHKIVPVLGPLGSVPETSQERLRSAGSEAIFQVAADFESLFASMILKEMRKTIDSGSLFANDPGDVYGSLFDFYLGKHIAGAGGLGIAKLVVQSLTAPKTGPAQ